MPDYLSLISGGVIPDGSQTQGASVISQGLPSLASAAPATSPLPNSVNTNGGVVSTTDSVNVVAADPSTEVDLIPAPSSSLLIPEIPTPNLAPSNFGVSDVSPGYMTYSGTNIKALLEVGDNPTGTARFAKELVELTTLSISIHRASTPARGLGFIGAKGYARGGRTIAGTMVFTQFSQEVLFEFLNPLLMGYNLSKDTNYVKLDQLPLFNMTLFFSNEYGYMSYRRLYGVNFITDGVIYSVNDLITEQTITYVASDFSPLTSLNSIIPTNNLNKKVAMTATNSSNLTSTSATEQTPGSILAAYGLPTNL